MELSPLARAILARYKQTNPLARRKYERARVLWVNTGQMYVSTDQRAVELRARRRARSRRRFLAGKSPQHPSEKRRRYRIRKRRREQRLAIQRRAA